MSLQACGDCGAKPGDLHDHGCDVERCPLCGDQLIGCDCVYEVAGLDPNELEFENPDIFNHGPTDEMWAEYDAEVKAVGGFLPWSGEYPGKAECRAFGLWCDPNNKCAPCDANHPGAIEDLNRLPYVAEWDSFGRCWRLCSP